MMPTQISYPVTMLLAYVDSEHPSAAVEDLRATVRALAASRPDWLLGPPQFVEETDDHGVRTIGLVHRVYAAFDEAGQILDESIDRAQFEEVRDLLEALRPVTSRAGIDLAVELDGGSVGWIEDGELSNGLRVGLLEAWRKRFA